MKIKAKVIGAIAVALMAVLVASCNLSTTTPVDVQDVAIAARGMRSLIPGIQAGLALVKPDSPTSRALDPVNAAPTNWPYGVQTPALVYNAAGGVSPATVRLPPTSGYYTMNSGDQIYLTLTPETALGAGYFRVLLYTYPAFDLSVANTIEEYIVNSAGVESWAWGNLSLTKQPNSYVSITTVYTDGTTGTRTVMWTSNATTPVKYFDTFTVTDPDPSQKSSFDGYRYEESGTLPPYVNSGKNYSSHVTETINAKNTTFSAIQYYTQTSNTVHSALTFVYQDRKQKKLDDIKIVTRSQEDTFAKTKKIRSVGEVGTVQYYIDKVDIAVVNGLVTYTNTHDVYNSILPRGVNSNADSGTSLAIAEDSPSAGTFTGTMEEVAGKTWTISDVTINRDSLQRFVVKMKKKSSGLKALASEVQIPLTRQDLSNMSISLPSISGTFTGYYEAGSLFGTISTSGGSFDVVVTDEGVAINDVLYPY